MKTKPETENDTRGDTVGSRSVMRRRIRAKLSRAPELDDNLCQLQDAGHQVYNIMPFNGSIKGETLDMGQGKDEIEMTVVASFVITYGQAL